jgi:adenylylsulfate kinase
VSGDVVWHHGSVTPARRAAVAGGSGVTVWFTGLSGSGKSTIAHRTEEVLLERGRLAYVLDGDNLRHGLNRGLGFSPTDRSENVRRVGEVARLMADAGLVVLVPVIAPYREDRAMVRRMHAEVDLPFREVFVDAPLDLCEARDPKGLYRRARAGEISRMTGLDDPYEAPEHADLVLDTASIDVESAVRMIAEMLRANDSITPR